VREPARELLYDLNDAGWLRYLPPGTFELLLDLAEGRACLRRGAGVRCGAADCAVWGTTGLTGQELESARRATTRLGAAFGLTSVDTCDDVVVLLTRSGVVESRAHGGWTLATPLPLVGESGALSAEEVAVEDRLRWLHEYEPLVQSIIRSFISQTRTRWATTLADVARSFDTTVDDAREAVEILVDQGDFSVEPMPVGPGEEFVLSVDWLIFHERRVAIPRSHGRGPRPSDGAPCDA
jgi:hypothetical protein